MEYKGYMIATAKKTGGKAGRGKNVTSSLQIRKIWDDKHFVILKQIRYKLDLGAFAEAVKKAKAYIDQIKKP